MKVRVELNQEDGGLESDFNLVEFDTIKADEVEGWADAVRMFVKIGSCVANSETILANALFVEGGWCVKDWGKLVSLLSDDAKNALRAALDSST